MSDGLWLAAVRAVSPSPSPEGCHPDPRNAGAFYCNFDRLEEQFFALTLQLDKFVLVIVVGLLAWALFSLVTGRSIFPGALRRLFRREPATEADRRKLSAAFAFIAFGFAANVVSMMLLGFPSAPVSPPTAPVTWDLVRDLAGPAIQIVSIFVAFGLAFTIRYLDKRDGRVSSIWDQVKGQAGSPAK